MDDDTAYMQLLLCNSQGEVSDLEIGRHALKYVSKAQGKKRKGDSLAGYAAKINK
jgi:hypothetical protein